MNDYEFCITIYLILNDENVLQTNDHRLLSSIVVNGTVVLRIPDVSNSYHSSIDHCSIRP